MTTSGTTEQDERPRQDERPAQDAAALNRARLAEALRARRRAPGRLAPNAERLAVLQLLDPGSTAYSEAVVLRLAGALDETALLAALRALPERHEWLRSRVRADADGVVQVLVDDADPDVRRAALDGDAPAAAGGRRLPAAAAAWVTALAEEPLDLLEGPLWRAGLARLAEDDHVLVLVVHHVACDATSLSVLLDELGERYEAATTGGEPVLPTSRSPRDVARALRGAAASPAAREAAVARAEALLRAAGEDAEPSRTSAARTDVRVRELPRAVSSRLARVADTRGLTPFAVVTAVVAAALSRSGPDGLAGPRSPALGAPVDLRWQDPGSEDVVALLVETAALVVDDVLDRSLLEAAGAVRDAVAAAIAVPAPLDQVVEELRRRGADPAAVLPRVYVNLLSGDERDALGTGGPAVAHVDLPLGSPKAEQSWTVRLRGDRVGLRLEHDPSVLDRASADALLETVLRLLDAALAEPATPLGELEVLDEEERERLAAWEGAAGPEPAEDLLTHVLAGMERALPVLVTDDGAVTGEELVARADALAAALLGAGVRPGDRVAVPSRRVPGLLVSLLAVLRAGAAFVPVDVGHPAERQALVARRAGASAVVGAPAWADALAAATGATAVAVDDAGAPHRPAPAPPSWPARTPQDLAYLMPTSGSTGEPKAVRVPDGAVVARSLSYREVLATRDVRFLLQSTLAFDASVYLFWVLATGGCLVLPRDEEVADPLALARLVHDHDVTDVFVVPGVLEALLGAAGPGSLVSLRRVLAGGDVVPPALAAAHHRLLPGTRLLDSYGPTETVVTATASEVTAADAASGRPLPIGRPHPGTTVRVVDAAGRRLPPGAVGELRIGGPCVAAGYEGVPAGDPAAAAFSVEEAGGREVRWYATGDLVSWRPDGQLEYRGRRDRQVKLRGQRVELGEVETALRRLPGVREAAVEVVHEGRPRLVGLVAPRELDATGLREALAGVLPPAWVPDAVAVLDALPRVASGKLDRAALRRRAAEHVRAAAPGSAGSAHPADGAGTAASSRELAVLGVLREVLSEDGLGTDDDFFAAGGSSLLAARLVGRLRAELDLVVPLHELVRAPSARGIAALGAEDATTAPAGPVPARLLPVRRGTSGPPVVLVARDGAEALVLQHALARALPDTSLWTLMRSLPAEGAEIPDLVADGRRAAELIAGRLPEGPVHVLGHSASGVVALEVARALGDRRGAAVLLDTIAPSSWDTPLARAEDVARGVVRRARMRREERSWPAPGADLPDAGSTRSRVRNHQDGQAVLRTRVRSVDFPVVVLTSEEARDVRGDDLGWASRCRDLEVVPLAGDHHAMLLAPLVDETARVVAGVVARW
ncbi:amino acid adenylation domain-containing protein [uncultured Pseudokineococcus sp.]|uniref:amino acid adenylation domain-containing protein n=1 Tax=uncultured Pseudokineococcus sp. TaxID=1642928 RepID=UPI002613C6D1|nr:amino acid adenylation domain-containing protein [uncultured Pseudokineococcus sp.]